MRAEPPTPPLRRPVGVGGVPQARKEGIRPRLDGEAPGGEGGPRARSPPQESSAQCQVNFPGGPDAKHLPTMRETHIQPLGRADFLEEEMAPHALAWKIPWMEAPGRLQSWGRKESDTTQRRHFLSFFH